MQEYKTRGYDGCLIEVQPTIMFHSRFECPTQN